MERWLDAETEEDFFRLQEELTSGRIRPAARATRVKKKKNVASPPPSPPPGNDVGESLSGRGPGIVGEVLERDTGTCIVSAPTPPTAKSSGFPEPQSYKVSKFALKRQKEREKAKKKTVRFSKEAEKGNSREENEGGEAKSIDVENKVKLNEMSAMEVKEAQLELASQLSGKTLEFLKKRGAKKSKQGDSSGDNASDGLKKMAEAEAMNTRDRDNTEQGTIANSKVGGLPAVHTRLRFDMDGKVIGVVTKEEWEMNMSMEQSALERDCLREDERGGNSDGYTMQEWCALSMSRVVGQRALAMQGLSEILSAARPALANVDAGLQLEEREVQIPESLGISDKVAWSMLWELGVEALDVGSVALGGLKDGAVSVVAGAISLINALCAETAEMEEIQEECDANPSVGWPILPLTQVVRSSESGVWEDDVPAEGKEWSIGSRGNLIPRLIHLGLLDAIGTLLKAPPIANLPALVLPLLLSCARAGEEMSLGMLGSKPVCDMLKESLSPVALTGCSAETIQLRMSVLKLVRVMAQSGTRALPVIQNQGLLALVRQHLFSLWMTEDSQAVPDDVKAPIVGMKLECLRMWRVCCLHGIFLARFDDMYTVLCHSLSAPCSSKKSTLCDACPAGDWMVAREAYTTLAAAVAQSAAGRPGEAETVSVGACTALIGEAEKWLQDTAVDEVKRLLASTKAGAVFLAEENNARHTTLSNPASEALGALAAVLLFLASYWSAQRQHMRMARNETLRLDLAAELILKDFGCGSAVDWVCEKAQWCSGNGQGIGAMGGLIVSLLRCAEALGKLNELSETLMQLVAKMHAGAFQQQQATSWPLKLNTPALNRLQSNLPFQKVALAALHGLKVVSAGNEGRQLDPQISLKAVELGLHVVTTLPPGLEAQGLKCLAAITDVGILSPVLTRGLQAVQHVLAKHDLLRKDVEMYQTQGGCPDLDLSVVAKSMLTTFAVSWLSLVPEEAVQQKMGESQSTAQTAFRALGQPAINSVSGSRMLLPHDWLTLEAFCVPDRGSALTSSNHPVVAMILLVLSLEAAQSRFLSAIPPGRKLRNVLGLVYLIRADELCPGLTGTDEVWQDDWVRRTLATLSEMYCPLVKADGRPLSSWCGEFFVRKLADVFASSSFGDPLFGRHVALLLQGGGTGDAVKWVWDELMEKQCLGLLPPMHSWFGGKESYSCAGENLPKQVLDFVRCAIEDGALERVVDKASGAAEYADMLLSGK